MVRNSSSEGQNLPEKESWLGRPALDPLRIRPFSVGSTAFSISAAPWEY